MSFRSLLICILMGVLIGSQLFGKDVRLGRYRFLDSPAHITSLAPLIIPDHSALFYHQQNRNLKTTLDEASIELTEKHQEIALGMLRDSYGLQLLMEEDDQSWQNKKSSNKVKNSFRAVGGSLSYYFPGHRDSEIGGIFLFVNAAVHLQLSFAQNTTLSSPVGNPDKDLKIYLAKEVQSHSFMMGKVGTHISLQITPHFGIKPWLIIQGAEKPYHFWDKRYYELLAAGKSDLATELDDYQGLLKYGVSFIVKTPLPFLPVNIIGSFDRKRNWMLGITLFDYNSYRVNNPKYYVGGNTKFLKQIKEQ